MDRDETLVAQALATSLAPLFCGRELALLGREECLWCRKETAGTYIGIETGKKCADHKDVGVGVQRHGGGLVEGLLASCGKMSLCLVLSLGS